MTEVILEPLANGMEEATINFWHYEEGDHVEEGADLVAVISPEGSFK